MSHHLPSRDRRKGGSRKVALALLLISGAALMI
jgi:hypothetical protein